MSSGSLQALLKKRAESEEEFELNIASIIDCFVVLITYLLVASSFISLGVLDVSVPTQSADAVAKPPAVELSVQLLKRKEIVIRVGREAKRFPASAGEWDFKSLGAHLISVKDRHPEIPVAKVAGDSDVEYKAIVKAIEITRDSFPAVSLGEKDTD